VIAELEQQIAALEKSNAELRQRLELAEAESKSLRLDKEKLELERDSLKFKLQDALRRIYGRRSEKVNPDQLVFDFLKLGDEASEELKAEEAQNPSSPLDAGSDERVVVRKRKKRKNPSPSSLPVRTEIRDVDPESKLCPCGCGRPMVKIGEKVTEELECEPAVLYIRRIVRPVYAPPHPLDKNAIVVAPLPPRPIDRGGAGSGLLAHVAVSKYADHLPLYRLEQIFERSGVEISRKTMCDWLGATAGLLEPIVDAQREWILRNGFLQADETPVQVMDPEFPGRTRRGFLWVYSVPWAETVFDSQTSRARAGPSQFLSGFKGYLQTDCYAGYDEIVRLRGIVRLGCWAHARRMFFKAKTYHPEPCNLILGMTQKLYRIEREAKENGLPPEGKVAKRKAEALPILEALKLTISEAASRVLPASLLGKAAQYTLGHWDELTRYVEVGEAEIDNNSVENAIRNVAVGRKNWLFLGHPEGGGLRAEVFYSLIVTCKRLGANPFEYLRDVIDRVSTHPASRIQELLPRFWLAERQKAAVAAQP